MVNIEELANMNVDSGSFLRFDNGYSFSFQVVDTNKIEKVTKPESEKEIKKEKDEI